MTWGPSGVAHALPLAALWSALALATPADGADFWLPMGFILVGVALFLWEVSMPGFFIAVPATVAVVLGIIGMVSPEFLTSPWVVLVGVLVAAPVTVIAIRVYRRLAPPECLGEQLGHETPE